MDEGVDGPSEYHHFGGAGFEYMGCLVNKPCWSSHRSDYFELLAVGCHSSGGRWEGPVVQVRKWMGDVWNEGVLIGALDGHAGFP